MIQRNKIAVCTIAGLLLSACGSDNQPTQEQRSALRQPLFATEHTIIDRRSAVKTGLDGAIDSSAEKGPEINPYFNPQRNAYFGDLHVHTAFSADALGYQLTARPDDAYRYAFEGWILLPPLDAEGRPTRRHESARSLDFMAVTDHAETLGRRASAASRALLAMRANSARLCAGMARAGACGSW